jgi:hypothetical protein
MPNAAGEIQGIAVPALPWLQTFQAGDQVRVARGVDQFGDVPGTVVRDTAGAGEWVLVELDHLELDNRGIVKPYGAPQYIFRPGELRRLS